MERHSEGTTVLGFDRSASPGRRLARVGVALGLSAAMAFAGACTRHNTPTVDPAVKTWFDTAFRPATDDMAKSAQAGKDVKDGCKAAGDALTTNEARMIKTPDPQLTELVKGYVAERREAWAKCAETGETPSPSAKIVEIQKRVNELTAKS
jgi:hypothetical protein